MAWLRVALCVALCAMPLAGHADPLIIAEFMAANDTTVLDADGDSPDWIEVVNTSLTVVDAEGWYLTDEANLLTKWRFPPVQLAPGASVVIFASGKDRTEPDIHTNFRLSGSGEYLALVEPDGGTIATQFRPRYPPQFAHASFGIEPVVEVLSLVEAGSATRLLVPSDDTLGDTWTTAEFDDTAWLSGSVPVGFDRKETATYSTLVATDIGAAMFDMNASVFMRATFDLVDPTALTALVLRLRYEDGLILHLNGQEVLRRNSSGSFFNSSAQRPRLEGEALSPEIIDLSSSLDLLQSGTNVLAIQGLNRRADDLDFLLWPELEALTVMDHTSVRGYFYPPTPGWPNGLRYDTVASSPGFSRESAVLTSPAIVELTAAAGEIRYTLDRTEPHELSPLYSESILIDRNMELRARNFLPGQAPSATVRHVYAMLDPELSDFSSDLPVLIVHTFRDLVTNEDFASGHIWVIDNVDSRNALTDPLHYSGFSGIKVRGSGSSNIARLKKSYGIETRAYHGDVDVDFPLLGLPSDSDWVLFGGYDFDLALIRNALIYALSNQFGHYSARTRFCEVFVGHGETVAPLDYVGVYSFMEKIKRSPSRINVDELLPQHTSEPEITGGYLLKIDRRDPGDSGFSAGGQAELAYNDPKEEDIENFPEQADYIRNYINDFATALNGEGFADPELGYEAYIDVDSWLTHHLLNVFMRNTDALRLSTHLYKPRGGKLFMGPVWDFDRSSGSVDARAALTVGWGVAGGTDYRGMTWWGRLFQDPGFCERYEARYLALRSEVFRDRNLVSTVDRMADRLREAQVRNHERWPGPISESAHGGWEGEIEHLKQWLVDRAVWIDTQYLSVPVFSAPPQLFESSFEFTIGFPEGEEPQGVILYTLNGPDPKGSGGEPVDEAIEFTGDPIVVMESTSVKTRVFHDGAWGELTSSGYVTELAPLVVTEVHYNPLREPGFRVSELEFIEVQNIGSEPLEIVGASIGPRPALTFDGVGIDGASLTVLQPGEHAVLIRDLEAFSFRYGTEGIKIVGEWSPRNASLTNAGQELVLSGTFGEELLRFEYDGRWYESANGGGNSLVIIDPLAPRSSWNEPTAWRPSAMVHGSPGRADVVPDGLQLPGDVTQDGRVDIGDAIGIIRHLFGGASLQPCASHEANLVLLDSNGDRLLNLSDSLHIIRYVFQRGAPPTLGIDCARIQDCPSSCP